MKKMRHLLSLALALVMVLSLSIPAIALSTSIDVSNPEEYEVLEINSGTLVGSSTIPIQDAIDEYFSFRQSSFKDAQAISQQANLSDTASITDAHVNSLDRNISLKDFWKSEGVCITSIDSEASIVAAEMNPKNGNVLLNVYEWTWVYYNNEDGFDAPATDYMGFATTHNMLASPVDSGKYVITSDIYDENDISGYTSPGYTSISTTEDPTGNVSINNSRDDPQSSLNRDGMPYVWNAIMYADQWVKHDIASSSSPNPSYYNPTYNTGASDCANFVSQCLKNSGFVFDPSSSSSRVAECYNQFWHNQDGKTTDSNCSAVWRRVTRMVVYWGDRYSYEAINDNMSNVFPGNPVVVSDEGHVAICVGYNSAGKPIINGHSRDVFHQVLSGYAKTIKINTSNRLSTTPASATTISTFPYTSSNQYLASEACKWYKFTVPSGGGTYKISTTGSSALRGVLCQAEVQGSLPTANGKMAMVPIQEANGSNNFTINTSKLSAGTYYLMVKHVTSSSSGSYGITFQKLS